MKSFQEITTKTFQVFLLDSSEVKWGATGDVCWNPLAYVSPEKNISEKYMFEKYQTYIQIYMFLLRKISMSPQNISTVPKFTKTTKSALKSRNSLLCLLPKLGSF